MDAKQKKIIKKFIKDLANLYGLSELAMVRKIGRFINCNDPVVVMRLLYGVIKEDK